MQPTMPAAATMLSGWSFSRRARPVVQKPQQALVLQNSGPRPAAWADGGWGSIQGRRSAGWCPLCCPERQLPPGPRRCGGRPASPEVHWGGQCVFKRFWRPSPPGPVSGAAKPGRRQVGVQSPGRWVSHRNQAPAVPWVEQRRRGVHHLRKGVSCLTYFSALRGR